MIAALRPSWGGMACILGRFKRCSRQWETIDEGVAKMTKQDDAEEVKNLLNRPKAGRPKKGSESPAVIGEKVIREQLALTTSGAVVTEAGFKVDDPHYKDLQMVSLIRQGIAPTRAAELVGYGKMQGTRVVRKLKKNAAFKAKVDNMILQSVENYKKSTQSLLPEISELDIETIRQYKADPTLLVQRPKAIANLRAVAGAVLPDGANITQVISVNQIESLQNIFQGSLMSGGGPVVDAEIVKDSK